MRALYVYASALMGGTRDCISWYACCDSAHCPALPATANTDVTPPLEGESRESDVKCIRVWRG